MKSNPLFIPTLLRAYSDHLRVSHPGPLSRMGNVTDSTSFVRAQHACADGNPGCGRGEEEQRARQRQRLRGASI